MKYLIGFFIFMGSFQFAHATWCEEHGGEFKRRGCFCPALGKSVNRSNATLCLEALISLTQDNISQITSRYDFLDRGCQGDFQESAFNSNLRCPGHILNEIEENQHGDWLGILNSPNEACKGVTVDNDFADASEFEKFISNHEFTRLGAQEDIISKCLAGLEVSEKVKSHFIAKYYGEMNRLKDGTISDIKAIANLESLLETPKDQSLLTNNCANDYIYESVRYCRRLNNECSAKGGIKEISNNTLRYLAIYRDLEKKLNKRYGRTRNQTTIRNRKLEKDKIKNAMALIEESYPWIKGKAFQEQTSTLKNEDMTEEKISSALRAQFQLDRNLLNENLKRKKNATKCMNSTYAIEPECNDMDQAIKESPRFVGPSDKEDLLAQDNTRSISEKTKMYTSSIYFTGAQCIENHRGHKQEMNNEALIGSIQIGITLATFGAGAIALPIGVASKASGFLSRAAQAGKIAMKSGADRNALLLKGALLGSSAVGSMYLLNNDLKGMVDKCDVHLQAQSHMNFDSEDNFQCPNKPQEIGDSYSSGTSSINYTSCAIDAALMSLDLLPLLPAFSKKLLKNNIDNTTRLRRVQNQINLSDSQIISKMRNSSLSDVEWTEVFEKHQETLDAAKEAIGRELSQLEKMSLLRAHYKGLGEVGEDGTLAILGNYTRVQKIAKARELLSNGFSREESKILLDQGIAGFKVSDDLVSAASLQLEVDNYLSHIIQTQPESSNLYRMAQRAQDRGSESFLIRDGNLVLKNNPDTIMLRGENLTDNIPTNQSNSSIDEVTQTRQITSNQIDQSLDIHRRSLSMSQSESRVLEKVDIDNARWIKNRRLGNKSLCSRTTSRMKVFRRELSNADARKLRSPKKFSYKNANEQSLNNHMSAQSPAGYMGVATSMTRSVQGGNGGSIIKEICIPRGAKICIIGGAESELVLMDSTWQLCP